MPASLLLSLLLVHPLLGFEFLIEDGHISFTSSVGMKELMLEVKIAVTSTTLSKLITTGTTTSVSMVTFMGKLTDTSVGTGIKRLIKKSTTHLLGISSIGNALLKYLTPTSNEPNSPDCFLSYSLVSDEDLETTEIILKKEWSQI